MQVMRCFAALVASLVLIGLGGTALATGKAGDDVAGLIKSLMTHGGADWSSVEDVKAIAWKPLPPKMLQDCLPDGGCFTRNGSAKIGGQPVSLLATGARTMVFNFYIKNSGRHVGEAALVEALTGAGMSPVLARCPLKTERCPAQFEMVAREERRGEGLCLAHLFLRREALRGRRLFRRARLAETRSGRTRDV